MIGVPRPGSVQSTLIVGRPVPTLTDPDYHSLLVANTIFAGAFGSRLVLNIREAKGYSYSPQGLLRPRRKGGLLSVQADVRNEVTGAAALEVFYELDRMATTAPTEEELTKAKRYQGGLYLLRNQLQGAVARTLASYWVNGLPPESLGEFVPKVRAVTDADVRRVGGAYFTSGSQTLVVVGEEARVKAELAPFGEVAFAGTASVAEPAHGGSSGTLVVLNKSDASASLIDVATGRAVATVATGEGPHEGATSPDGRTVLVTNYGGQKAPGTSLTVIDVTAGKAVGTIELGSNRRPHGVRWLDARRALVTAEGIRSLLVVDVPAGRVEAAIQTGQDVSHMVAATPDGTRAFVANIGSGNVTAVDLAGGQVLAQIATGKGAEGIDVSPDGKEVWVTNRESDTVSVVDAASLTVVATLPSASFPIRVKLTPDGKRALVSNAKAGDVAVFDAVARRELARIKMPLTAVSGDGRVLPFPGTVPIGIVVTPDGSRAFVAHANADAVAVVDLATLAMTGSLKAGKEPDGMAYSPLRVSVR
jgi:YVTN family beta-propeller protein